MGAAQAQAAEHESRMALLNSRWNSAAGKATLASLYGNVDAMTNQLNRLVNGISNLRTRGYRYGRTWEEQIASLQEAWARQREEATRILEDERRNLDSATYDVQNLLNRAVREPGLVTAADSRISNFERQVSAAEQRVNGVYASTSRSAAELSLELTEAETVVEALESASFQLFPEESGLHVCEAEWFARGTEPLEGMLFLTDSRLLFEQRQEVVTKKVLFFKTEKKMEQELLWYAPVGGIEVVGMEDKKELLKARKELLTLRLEGGDAPQEVTLNLTNARNEDWARLLKRAKEGQFDFEHIEAAPPPPVAEAEAPVGEAADTPTAPSPAEETPLPTKCPSCNAALPTIYKGMREVRCAYCDTLIRLD
jgi:predicted  nucleic acid-binding Zn-ribbon protein